MEALLNLLDTGPDLWRGRRRDGRFARSYKRLIAAENRPDGCVAVLQTDRNVMRSIERPRHETEESHASIQGEPTLRTSLRLNTQ